MFVQEYRASKILYNFLVSNNIKGPFILPANVCGIIPLTFHYAKVKFDFFDIQNDNLCIDQNKVLENVNNYIGLLFVRTYGIEDNFEMFFKKLKTKNPNFIIIDDCCLCMPNLNEELKNNVDLKLYSLGYAKQIDLKIGSFGYLSSIYKYNNIYLDKFDSTHFELFETELKNAVNSYKLLEIKDYYFLDNAEYVINKQLIEEGIHLSKCHKNKLNEIYKKELPTSIQMNSNFQNWRFNIVLKDEIEKKKILELLFENKLFASSHYYPISITLKNQLAPNSLFLHKRVINLFNDFYYTEQQAIETCKIINGYFLDL